MQMFSMTNEELEESADVVKVAVLSALVGDGLLDEKKADEWAEKHTILHRKKSFFRTLSEKWAREKPEATDYYYIVISRK